MTEQAKKPASADTDKSGKVDQKELDTALKSGKTAEATHAEATPEPSRAAKAAEELVASSQPRLVAVSRLRRDTMILHSSQDYDEINKVASEAVTNGRASEVFIFEALGYFSESEVDFVEPDIVRYGGRAEDSNLRPPLLNPGKNAENALDVAKADPGDAPQAPTPTQGAKGHAPGEEPGDTTDKPTN